jgi:hypothetical protein
MQIHGPSVALVNYPVPQTRHIMCIDTKDILARLSLKYYRKGKGEKVVGYAIAPRTRRQSI